MEEDDIRLWYGWPGVSGDDSADSEAERDNLRKTWLIGGQLIAQLAEQDSDEDSDEDSEEGSEEESE